MSKIIDFLKQDDTIVVLDLDGVMSIYEYGELNHNPCHMDEFDDFLTNHDSYAKARPNKIIQNFVNNKNPNNIYVCSHMLNLKEGKYKYNFIKKYYPSIPFKNIFLVGKVEDKLEVMKTIYYNEKMIKKIPISEKNIAIIEDTVSTLSYIQDNSNFTTVHITSFMD